MQNDLKKRALRRLRIVAGQVKGLERAIEREQYCIDVLTQSLAVQRSLKSLDRLILENHLKTCYRKNAKFPGKVDQAIKELLDVYSLSAKS